MLVGARIRQGWGRRQKGAMMRLDPKLEKGRVKGGGSGEKGGEWVSGAGSQGVGETKAERHRGTQRGSAGAGSG